MKRALDTSLKYFDPKEIIVHHLIDTSTVVVITCLMGLNGTSYLGFQARTQV